MTHLKGQVDLAYCFLSGCCRSVGLAVGGNWARYKVFPMVSLPGWAFVVWGHSLDAFVAWLLPLLLGDAEWGAFD